MVSLDQKTGISQGLQWVSMPLPLEFPSSQGREEGPDFLGGVFGHHIGQG